MILQTSLFPPKSSWTVPDIFPQFTETETIAIDLDSETLSILGGTGQQTEGM